MSRSTKLILLLLALTLSVFAAVPTIMGISVTSVTHNSAYVCYNVMPTSAWTSVQYGTASGVYGAGPTNNYQVSSSSPFLAGQACFSLTNLKGSTTYYILPTAQPNQTNTTDVCNVSGCGAVEQIITTPADPGSPVFPTAPATFAEPNPDTSTGYTTVRMIAGSPECTAASTVGPITYGMTSWTVHSGDTIQTVINEVGYGAILEFDQGVTCLVPGVNTYNSGYWFGYKAVDPNASGINDPAHRYIIFQTKTVAAADFPPFSVRTSPALAPNTAIWQANTQETVTTGLGQTLSVIDNPGSGSTMQPHHLLVRNMAFQVNQTTNTGRWGQVINMGACCTSPQADYISFQRIIVHGSPLVDTAQAIQINNTRAALNDSWFDNIHGASVFAQGLFLSSGSTGPYNISNNYINCVCMAIYQESNEGFNNPANDVTFAYNTIYTPLSELNTGYLYRQPAEFKGGHRVSIAGNLFDGSWVYQNAAPAILLFGIPNYIAGNGVSDVLVDSNLIRNTASMIECVGNDAGDDPSPQSNVTQRIWISNNLGYNMGYANHIGAGGSGGGAVNFSIGERAGCPDMTVTQNTIGPTDPHDTRMGSTLDFIPAVKLLGGGTTFSPGSTFTNNVVFVSYGSSAYNGGRIFADNPQSNPTYPRLPATVVSNPTNTPTQVLNSLSLVTTNAGSTPNYTWQGNLNICFNFDNGSNNWTDQTSGQCTTTAVGMPSTGGGDTWAAGNTTAARAAAVGLDTTTWNCSGCGGAGVNVSNLYPSMKAVTSVGTPVPASTSAVFTYTAPDSRACAIDTSPDGTTWTRTTDGGGVTTRTTSVTGLSAATAYSYRILCYFSQLAPLWNANYITDGTFTTNTASASSSSPSGIVGFGIATH